MAREGAAAEGHDVDARHLVLQPLGVTYEGGHVREDPVREADGLRGLCLIFVGGGGGLNGRVDGFVVGRRSRLLQLQWASLLLWCMALWRSDSHHHLGFALLAWRCVNPAMSRSACSSARDAMVRSSSESRPCIIMVGEMV